MQRTELTNGVLISIGKVIFKFTEDDEPGYCSIKQIAIKEEGDGIKMIPEQSQRSCIGTIDEKGIALFTTFGYSYIMLRSEEIPFSKISLSPIQL